MANKVLNFFNNKKVKKSKVSKSILDILPFVKIEDYIYLKNGCLEILEVEGKDIFSLQEEEVKDNIFSFQTFLRSYSSDFKLVVMDFPVDTTSQQSYIEYKIKTCTNKFYVDFLNDRLNELKRLEATTMNTEYYIFIFAKDKSSLNDSVVSFKRLFSAVGEIYHIENLKKEKILYKLNNMNSKI